MDLSFLSDMTVKEAPKSKAPATQSTPINGDIRIRRAGKIEFTEAFKNKVGDSWIDMFFAHDWLQYDKEKPNVCFININKEDKAPKADIKGEGTSVFIKNEFWAKAVEIFKLDPEVPYADLTMEDIPVTVPIALIPKVVQRGADKGSVTYVKREAIVLYPLTVDEAFLASHSDEDEEATDVEQVVESVDHPQEEINSDIPTFE